MPQTALVYRFHFIDRATGERVLAEHFATEKAIEQMGAEIVPESVRSVDSSHVTFSGLVKPPDYLR